jgi:hypothetical protein
MAAAALVAASVLSLAGTGSSFATAAATGGLQIAAADTSSDSTATAVDRSLDPAQGTPAVAAGQTDAQAPADQTADATTETASTQQASAASNDDSSGWDKASIIGKIFIACGTLLTLGSAARMFMI